tara:strand:- start:25992 stop:27299 length:1308 start_codon:yes stop_codon:yes gene_type:complete
MANKNILEQLSPSKHNPIDRRYAASLDDSLPSTTAGITGENVFVELSRMIEERNDRDLLPDGNTFSAVMVSSTEIKITDNSHACMVPRDLWNTYAANPSGFSMYKCRVAIDFRDCNKPAPSHIAKIPEEMSSRDLLRSQNYSLAFGLFLKKPQAGEQYRVKILNKTKDFCGDEIIVLDKEGTYDFIKAQSMKQRLATAGGYDSAAAAAIAGAASLQPGYPMFNGANMIVPAPGHTRVVSGFGASRSQGAHEAIDINMPVGTKIVSQAKGKIIGYYSRERYDKEWKAFYNYLNENEETKATMQGTTQPTSWADFKKMCAAKLGRNKAATILRALESKDRPMQLSGVMLIVRYISDDGLAYDFYYQHVDRFTQSWKKGDEVQPGQTIVLAGDTAIFDSPAHLHLSVRQVPNPNNDNRQRGPKVDPESLIPGLEKGYS